MKYNSNLGPWGSIFPVPTAVVDRQIKLCSGVQLKVLLVLLRHGGQPSPAEVAALLGLPAADVTDAINYWVHCGVLTEAKPSAETQSAPAPAPAAAPAPQPPPNPKQQTESRTDPATGQKISVPRSRTRLSTADINRMAQSDPNIAPLLQETQLLLGKELTPAETDTLLYLYSYFNLSPQYLFTLISYCVSRGKGNMRYIERTAAGWVDQGIDTPEQAERHIDKLNRRNTNHVLVQSAFGLRDRELTTKEKEFITLWFDSYNMSIEMIKLAYERTVDNTNKVAFPYIDKILREWSAKKISTPEQARQEMGSKPKEARQSTPSYDMDKINWIYKYGKID